MLYEIRGGLMSVSRKKQKETDVVSRRRVTFCVMAERGASVYLSGTFNGWSRDGKALKDKDGTGKYTGCLLLAPGRYEYKFVINGIWEIDKSNLEYVPNGMGTLNSVLVVE